MRRAMKVRSLSSSNNDDQHLRVRVRSFLLSRFCSSLPLYGYDYYSHLYVKVFEGRVKLA